MVGSSRGWPPSLPGQNTLRDLNKDVARYKEAKQ
jgi:hypothetical protein